MNWKAEAMEKLNRYHAMRQALQNIPEEIRRLEADAQALRCVRPDQVSVKGSTNKREDMLINSLVYRQELQEQLRRAKSWVKITDRALAALTPEEKLILHRMYIMPEKGCLERLTAELGVEQSSIYRKRDKALHRFTVALYGIPEA